MAQLNKVTEGLMFFDDFKEQTLMWTLSPSDANNLRFSNNGLTMLHNKYYTTYTIVEPEAEEYSCIVELDHAPYNYSDIGGVIVLSNNEEYAECQSFKGDNNSEINGATITQEQVRALVLQMLDEDYVQYMFDSYDRRPADTANIAVPVEIQEFIRGILDDYYAPYEFNSVRGEIKDDNASNIETENVISLMSLNNDENIIAQAENNDEDEEDPIDFNSNFDDKIYRFIKFHKTKNTYLFFASVDGFKWIEVGNVSFETSNVIGFFLYGTEDEKLIANTHFNVKSFALYNSKYLTVNGIDKKYEIEIYDEDGNILLRTDDVIYTHLFSRTNKRLLINTTTMPMPIKNPILRTFPKDDYETTIGRYELGSKIYGGDIFSIEHNFEVKINDRLLSSQELHDLGSLLNGRYIMTITVKNCEDYAVKDVKIKVVKYSEYYGGEEEVSIALNSEGVVSNTIEYTKEITIDEFLPNETKNLNIKLDNKQLQGAYDVANLYRFKIVIE